MIWNCSALHFFYNAQNKPAVALYDGVAYAYMYNLQGDVIALVDANGTPVVEYRYDAWGKPISKTGTLATTLGTLNPFRYRGYVFDEETGLYYLRSRYYNPEWSRFVNADVNGGQVSRINSHNTFSYCMNDPTSFSDDSGYWASNALKALCGMINKVASVIINSTRELLSTNRIIGEKAILNGKVYNLRKPPKGPTISSPPKTLAEGHSSITKFSGKQAWINFAIHDVETTAPFIIFANAHIYIDVDVHITQTGNMEPTACITMSLWRMNADTSNGYHIQEKVSSGIWQVYGGDGNKYIMGNADGVTQTFVDEDGWIQLALESIEWE